ncbi:MAG: hypothetical protein LUE27_03800 [Clostridia bacterium]|nr:hypothetical protein [Clostridia bacterium]
MLVFAACTNEEGEADYARHATVTSDSSYFTADETGGTVTFGAEGGSAVLSVDCGTDWTMIEEDTDWLTVSYSVSAGTVSISAGQSTVEKDQNATLTLATAETEVRFATINIVQNAYTHPDLSIDATSWHVPAVGDLSTTINVTFNADWSVETSASWITVETAARSFTLTAAENTATEERTAEVTVTCTDGVTSDTATISVTQDAAAYITVDSESIEFEYSGATASVGVTSNYSWTASSSESWIAVSGSGSTLTVTTEANDSEDAREGFVLLTASDGAYNVAQAQVAVTQDGKPAVDPSLMIFLYTMPDGGGNVQLPFSTSATIDCWVDWGDGSDLQNLTSYNIAHAYSAGGEYTVTVSGTMTALKGSNVSFGKANLTEVVQWGLTGLTNLTDAFINFTALTKVPADTEGSFADVTACNEMFYGCSALTDVDADLFAYMGDVVNFTSVFRDCTSLESVPASLFDNCKLITTIQYAFMGCTAMTGESPYTMVDGEKIHLYERDNCPDEFSHISMHAKTFNECTNMADYDDLPSGWY